MAFKTNRVHAIPAAKARPAVKTLAFDWYVYRCQNQVWVEQQPAQGIWAKLWVFPQTARIASASNVQKLPLIKHRLTHRALEIYPYLIELDELIDMPQSGQWLHITSAERLSLALPKPAVGLIQVIFEW